MDYLLFVLTQELHGFIRPHFLPLSIHEDLVRRSRRLISRGGFLKFNLGILVVHDEVLHVVLVLGEDCVTVLVTFRGHEMVAVIQVIAGDGSG